MQLPQSCGPDVQGECLDEAGNPVPNLQGFYIRGFTVEELPGERDSDPLRERLQDHPQRV